MQSVLEIPRIELYKEAFKRRLFDFVTVSTNGKHLKQEMALNALTDQNTFDVMYGGAAGGAKSWTGCTWLAFMCLTYPGTRWFIGREELKRLRESTLITFYKVCKEYGIKKDIDFKYNGQDHFIDFSNGSRIMLLDLKYLPSDPLYERYGSVEFTGGWIEEGGEVHFDAFDTLKSRIGRQLNDVYNLGRGKLFVSANPKKNWLYNYYYKPYVNNQLKPTQKFIQALIHDNPFKDSGYLENLTSISDPTKKARLLEGNWEYDDDPAVLMPFEKTSDLFKNEHVPRAGLRYITADIARLGDDKTRVGVWEGLVMIARKEFSGMRVDDVAKNIRLIANEYRVPMSQTIVDADGVGGGVADILRCKELYNNSKALHNENYRNVRSQLYFKLSEYVNDAKIYLPNIPFAEQEIITQELGAIKKKNIDGDGKQEVSTREDIISLIQRSPDYATKLMLRMWFEIKAANSTGATKLY